MSDAHWLVLGASGQLGSAFTRLLAARGISVRAFDEDLDVADPDALARELDGARPEVVVNAAAFTHVDRCEREPELAMRINGDAPTGLARLCAERSVGLVHVSTDYVFDGEGERPYREDDPPAPVSAYGRTKLAGERGVLEAGGDALVVRTSWVFGRGRNFIAAILGQVGKGGPLRVVEDQLGRPTYAGDLAEGIFGLLSAGRSGLYHLANHGVATWWDVAREALDTTGHAGVEIERIRTADLDLDAPRPRYSVLDCRKAEEAGVRLPDWRDALASYLRSQDAPEGASRVAAEDTRGG